MTTTTSPSNLIRRALRRALLAVAVLGVATGAQGAYPDKPVRLVVPYPAGGGADTIARTLGKELSERWQRPVIIDNRPGASGITGGNAVARAKPDGLTLLLGITAMAQLPALYANLPFDVRKDFEPISEIARSQDFLVVPNRFGISSLEQFLARMKAEPGEHSYGSYGTGTSSHIHGEMLRKQAGLDLVHVPYRGAAPLITDVLGERLTLGVVDTGSVRSHLNTGRFEVLAVTGAERSPLLPETPTLTELGYRDYEPYGWYALFAPAGVPTAILDELSEAVQTIVAQDNVQDILHGLGLRPVGNSRSEFAKIYDADVGTWTRVIEDTGIRLE